MFKNPNWVYGPKDVYVPAHLSFSEYIVDKLWEYKNNICFINAATEETQTFGEILQDAMNIAVSLRRLGVRKGQVIAVCSENRREFYPSVIGAICAGAVVTTINVGYTKGELKHVLNISKPYYIFCSPFTYKNYEKAFKELRTLKKIIVFSNEQLSSNNVILYNDLVIPSNVNKLLNNVKYEEFKPVDVNGYKDALFILYSSGTTGLPKGVILTHLNVINTCCMPSSLDPTLLGLTITPWFHVMGLVGNIAAMTKGRSNVYLPKFEPDLYLKTIEKYKIVQLTVVPPVLVALCKVDFKYDVSSVQIIYSGAAPLHKETLQAVETKFPGAKILQGYGMTELTLAAVYNPYSLMHLAKPGGVGFAVPNSVIKVADIETGRSLGPNESGEICVQGPLVMKGYLGKNSKDDFDDDGFFKTGDIGYYDEDRCFFIVDRLKELIKYKGYQVPPAEIEAILLQHEGIKDAGVVGVEHREGGEAPRAYVVRQPGINVTEEEVQKFVAERLSNPKHLRGGVRFVEQIPKNPSGKIIRKQLRAMARSERSKL